MQNSGIRNEDMDHELALKLPLVSIQILNHPKIIKYILYFKIIPLKSTYRRFPSLLSSRRLTLQIVQVSTIVWLLDNHV